MIPSKRNSFRVDSKTSEMMWGKSVENKRKVIEQVDQQRIMVFEKVKSIATEGAFLTLVGKISYDIS